MDVHSRPGGTRRRAGILAAMAALTLAACGTGSPSAPAPASAASAPATVAPATSEPSAEASAEASEGAGGTVTVGFIAPTTGFVAALGTDMQRGWELYWELHGTTAGGVTVETVYEDDAGDPEVALTKARRLVEEVGVDMTAGPILANTAYAVADYVAAQGVPSFHISGADDLTQRKFNPLVMRVGMTSSQSNFPAGKWAYDQGHRNAMTICPDYGFGWESCGGFVSGFTDAGGTVSTQIWHPLGTQDFSTYVTQAQSEQPDVVFIGSAGGPDAILFWEAWTSFGLQDQVPLIGNCCFADQVLLRDQGEAANGITSFSYWTEGRDSEAVRTFVSAYEEAHGEIPSLYAAGSYLMAEVIAKALEETGGVVDGEAFVKAAQGLTFADSVYGPFTFDDTNNIVGDVNREHVEARADGTYWNVVDETFSEVSQFWTYGKDAFLANPVFSREYTGQ
jgi:branched-chain amino acid transport system substrate-binding protein